ncbi:peptidase domain-containing protein [Methanolobus mangrovi]|uniref:Peptidase domain-containing protein n=1 Tax=Methanolobus mangrovi TaxID=3072977 RepID=A0AA51UHR5_9EURY|nr:peptidase domain-containing protein [Methanolobus mangrovi]WMW23213.1 peptidase domain-containing protein [Methanolobus mangrovi]
MKTIAIGFIIFLLCISVASASTSETDNEFTLISASDLGYKIVPAKSDDGSIGVRTVSDIITQGETNWHSFVISSYYTSIEVDLNWGDTSDSLKLYIYDPSYNCLGYFYDSADGSINGRIHLNVIDNDGIERGTWRYRVYGYSVSGTEDYSI